MNHAVKVVILLVLAAAVAAVLVAKQVGRRSDSDGSAVPVATGLPRLLDLGSDKCVPCKMMAPILNELKQENAGRLLVEVVDVWENPEMARRHGVSAIPTQVFYDGAGKERFRHEGFMPKSDILAVFAQMGYRLEGGASSGE